jgi:CubicO group peptidase (beta-lactamase class C family)
MISTIKRKGRRPRRILAVLLPLLVALASRQSLAEQQEKENRFKDVDAIVEKAVAEGNIPGAVLLVGHNGKVVHRRAFGERSLEPLREPMTVDTIFDLASLTKCIATATSIMKLVEQGRIRVGDSVATYLPDFAQNGKKDITIRDLLTHYSGMPPDLDLKSAWSGREMAYEMAMSEKPINPPGSQFVYSDINFETLGFLVEKITGQTLNEFASANIFVPLGMKHTRFLPPREWEPRIAPTQYDEQGQMLRGVVHDPTARRMGGPEPVRCG